MRLVAAMLVRDEADRYLRRQVEHLLAFCDLVVAIDDGSEDDSVEILRSFPRVIVHQEPSSLWDAEGESVVRDKLLRLVFRLRGIDWVLSIDADEFVSDGPRLRRFLENVAPDEFPSAVSLRMVEVWERALRGVSVDQWERGVESVWRIRVDGGWAPRECPVVWTPPQSELSDPDRWNAGWTIPEQKLACGREPEVVRFADAISSGVDLCHLGWSNPEEREARYERYLRIDGGRFHADAHIRSIVEEPTLEPYPTPEGWT